MGRRTGQLPTSADVVLKTIRTITNQGTHLASTGDKDDTGTAAVAACRPCCCSHCRACHRLPRRVQRWLKRCRERKGAQRVDCRGGRGDAGLACETELICLVPCSTHASLHLDLCQGL